MNQVEKFKQIATELGELYEKKTKHTAIVSQRRIQNWELYPRSHVSAISITDSATLLLIRILTILERAWRIH